jgi:hypothetical protein
MAAGRAAPVPTTACHTADGRTLIRAKTGLPSRSPSLARDDSPVTWAPLAHEQPLVLPQLGQA